MGFLDLFKQKKQLIFTLDIEELAVNIENATKDLQKVLGEVYGKEMVQSFEEAASKGKIKGTTSPKSEALAHYGNYYQAAQIMK